MLMLCILLYLYLYTLVSKVKSIEGGGGAGGGGRDWKIIARQDLHCTVVMSYVYIYCEIVNSLILLGSCQS